MFDTSMTMESRKRQDVARPGTHIQEEDPNEDGGKTSGCDGFFGDLATEKGWFI